MCTLKIGQLMHFKKITFLSMKVRAFQLSCNGKAACNCGLAVRSGDDVILLDGCQSAANEALKTKIFTNGELTQGTSVKYNRKRGTYKVYLPPIPIFYVICLHAYFFLYVYEYIL